MAYLESTQLRKGTVFKHQGKVYIVLNYKHVKKGRGLATVKLKVRDIEGGASLEETFTSNEKVESADVSHKSAQYLYSDDKYSHFMDSKEYSQFHIDNTLLEWERNFLTEGQKIIALLLENRAISIKVPKKVKLHVTYTEPGVIGNTAGSATKDAKLETGFHIQVPLFIKKEDKIVVNTDTGRYVSRGTS